MGRVGRDSLAAAEETIDGKAVSIDSKDSLSKFKDSSFVNSNFCTKCKKEESVDGRWIQCDKCLKWYHTACVRIQLDNNGKFSGDYYCRQCRRLAKQETSLADGDRNCKTTRRLSVSSASSSRSSGSTHKKLKVSNGSASRTTPPPSEPFASLGNYNGVAPMEFEVDHATSNRHSFNNSNINEFHKKQTCKLQKNGSHQKSNNIHHVNDHLVTISNGNGHSHGGRKEKKTSFATTTTDSAESPILFHPYNWPHPVSYNRALHRVAQIREFILTHCPAAASPLSSSSIGGIGINGIVENKNLPESSIKIAIGLWNKLERLEKSHNRKHLSLPNHNS